ncbi:MAG: glycoside hydrolase family 15 protein [Patescibacteria group bacterium]|nr:glycoside hydrolase family 15 protein [Patescibacteria group bacterium]
MYHPIRDYAIIGNLRSAALVSKKGSIDWAPVPFIDSPSIFTSILDDKKGGFWSIAPKGQYVSSQRYAGDSNVLTTTFQTKRGTAKVVDFIPIEKERVFMPSSKDTTFRIHRKVVCVKGTCTMQVVFDPQLDYGRQKTHLSLIDGGVLVTNGKKRGVLAAKVPFTIMDGRAVATVSLRKGESHFFIFRYNTHEITVRRNDTDHHEAELREVQRYWHNWTRKCDLAVCPTSKRWHKAITRSALLLKILFFEPIGTIAAAPTTSLPESMGGIRNWDYRFTWIRDSVFTLHAFFRMGHVEEAEKYFNWLMHECYGASKKPEDLRIVYGLHSESKLDEEILPHLAGYKNSKPVRIGNAAYDQKQWDIYGSILDTAWQFHQLEKSYVITPEIWVLLRSLANYVTKIWKEPDEGLWEVRGGKSHFVYSKVMCWVALDRAIKLAEAYDFNGEIELWRREKNEIHAAVMKQGWSEKEHSFVQSFGSEDLDASVLRMPVVGFIDGQDPRMLSTLKQIKKELLTDDGFVYRYTAQDGLPGTEGAFLLASFWLVDAMILAGETKEARILFENVVTSANHVGLLPEEINPVTKEFLGNFPQAYTHIGLINSAFNLEEAEARSRKNSYKYFFLHLLKYKK